MRSPLNSRLDENICIRSSNGPARTRQAAQSLRFAETRLAHPDNSPAVVQNY